MSRPTRLPQYLLHLGWSAEKLAREINKSCGDGSVSPKAPYWWLKGTYPRGSMPAVVAEVLANALGEHVDVAALWPDAPETARKPSPRAWPWASVDFTDSADAMTAVVGEHANASRTASGQLSSAELLAMVTDCLGGDGEATDRTLGTERGPVTPAALLLETRSAHLRILKGQHGTVIADWVVHDLRAASELARTAVVDGRPDPRLHHLLAELGQMAGSLFFDSGQLLDSQLCLLASLRAARASGDRALAGFIVACLGYHALWSDTPEDTIELIGLARRCAGPSAPGAVRALICSWQARAFASVGDHYAALRVLREAVMIFTRPDPSTPGWARWIDSAVLAADTGRAHLDLGDPTSAERQLVSGLRRLDRRQQRIQLLHRLSVAEARLDRGEVHGAAQVTRNVIATAGPLVSTRTDKRLRILRRRFSDHDQPATRQLASNITDVLSAGHLTG